LINIIIILLSPIIFSKGKRTLLFYYKFFFIIFLFNFNFFMQFIIIKSIMGGMLCIERTEWDLAKNSRFEISRRIQ